MNARKKPDLGYATATDVPVQKTRAEIEAMVLKHGAFDPIPLAYVGH